MTAKEMFKALRALESERVPHPCGGYTTDDIQWRLGVAFTPEREMADAIEELSQAGLIRYAGYDEDDAIGHCYAPTLPFGAIAAIGAQNAR